MHDNVIRLYRNGQLTNLGLARAVGHGWITAEEYMELTGEDYTPAPDIQAEYTDAVTALETLGYREVGNG